MIYIKFGINCLTLFILLFLIYKRVYKKNEFIFTLSIFNILLFFLCYFLQNSTMGLWAVFGLFAVFSILRFKTESITIKDMTYLFIVISLGLLSALSSTTLSLLGLVNCAILVIVFLIECYFLKNELTITIQYDKIELLSTGNQAELFMDIQNRTGFCVTKIVTQSVNLINQSAVLKVYYRISEK